jgi:putative transcriptional regulator
LKEEGIIMKTKHDWKHSDAMAERDILAAAMDDVDSAPLSDDAFKQVNRTPQVKIIRRAMKLSQDEFAARFRIPVGTLRDAATRAYLVVIARDPDAVVKALATAA